MEFNDLVEEARCGNILAENQLFSKLRARISNLVEYYIYNKEDAEDLIEDIMVVAIQKYKTTVFEYGIFIWIQGIMKNKIKQYVRNRKTRMTEQVTDGLQNGTSSAETFVEEQELQNMIHVALSRLSDKEKEIIRDLLNNDIKNYITNRSANTPLGTIYSNIHRARTKFKYHLEEEGFEHGMY